MENDHEGAFNIFFNFPSKIELCHIFSNHYLLFISLLLYIVFVNLFQKIANIFQNDICICLNMIKVISWRKLIGRYSWI